VISQINEEKYLMNKADSLLQLKNWTQSRYFYGLAEKKCIQNDSCTYITTQSIKKKITIVDSLESYHHKDVVYVKLIQKADSLLSENKDVYAMKSFDDASLMYPSLPYPRNKITHIINTSKTIQGQLMVIQANQKRQRYKERFEHAMSLEEEDKKIEAYYEYLSIADEFHNDKMALEASERLFMQIEYDLKLFEESLNMGNEFFLAGKYTKSKNYFESALALNSSCTLCEQRLKYLNFYIEAQQSKKGEYELIKNKAYENYIRGKYNESFYQYIALSKKNPSDKEVQEKIIELDALLQSELDEKIKKFNADLLLERANELYVNKNFEEAASLYLKIDARYTDVISYHSFVKLRIAECLRELEFED
jgi:hypothetical protein